MKEVFFCFIEPHCLATTVENIAHEEGRFVVHQSVIFRNLEKTDAQLYKEVMKFVDNGQVISNELAIKIYLKGLQNDLTKNLFLTNFTKYQELLQELQKEGYHLKHICYIYHEDLDYFLEYYKQKGQRDIAESMEHRILQKRKRWEETIFAEMPHPLVRIGWDVDKFDEFQENIKQLFV
jgi:adenylate kinase family enzyme